jgi:predicted lipoprotein with Yx(FWY)xxD motif
MRARTAFSFSAVGLVFGAALLTACSSPAHTPPVAAASTAASGAVVQQAAAGTAGVKISDSSLGPILTDQNGRTLYAFTRDKNGTSSCTADCIATWPALISRGPATASSGAQPSLLSTTNRAEGTVQATYNGWPLYYYVGDVAPGDVDGEGSGGVWFVVGADGKLVKPAS